MAFPSVLRYDIGTDENECEVLWNERRKIKKFHSIFENRKIRTVWDDKEQEWYFSVVDVVAVLTDSADPKQYIKKMRARDPELNSRWGTICTLTAMTATDGKRYRTSAANLEGVFRIIQSIPSPKAEPLKLWLAQVGSERIEETIDPEQAIDRALETYLKKGYDENWVRQRLLSIRIRNELTAEWKQRGMEKSREFAILTDEITKAWAGMSTRQYKKLKGLKKENLRDNMTDLELVLTMLAEASTTDISKVEQPETFEENMDVARQGGEVAGVARQALEQRTGRPVITSQNAQDFRQLISDVVEDVAALPERSDREKESE